MHVWSLALQFLALRFEMGYQEANQASVVARRARRGVKTDLRTGTLSLTAALRSPVALIGDLPTYELLLAVPQLSHARLAILNSYAIEARVNLCLPVVVLTERQRTWIVAACDTIARGVDGEWVGEAINYAESRSA